jgi:LemA protein
MFLPKMDMFFVLLGLTAIAGIAYATLYNGLVKARQKVQEAWSGIDVQLKRRYDLIPNLINTVKGYAKHEREVLENTTNARATAMAVPDASIAAKAKAEGQLTSSLRSLFALAENYPDLKANENFLSLQNQLAETEDQIASARRIYNGNVTVLNVKVESFPSNFVANMHQFEKAEFFEVDEAEKEAIKAAPKVEF